MLSGGIDSATALYWARSKGYRPYCLLFNYGQRHSKEIHSARRIAQQIKAEYKIISLNLPWKGSSLTDLRQEIPQHKKGSIGKEIPSTYVPARNTIFLSFGLSWSEVIDAEAVVIGANALDFSGYPDCRPGYIRLFRKLAREGTKRGAEGKNISILAPLIKKSKADIIRLGMKLSVPFALTWSCYKGGRRPCGKCDSCRLREKGFREAGVRDPLIE